ncbi:FxLYD domain-containing protein [Streptomyces sp. BH106]|uniref:FxLYD domain-containing protein n=1 Tax=Streptomyces sp. BH106 TaxID=3410409 RepID=UPI003CF41871
MTTPEYAAAPSPQEPKKKPWVRRHKFVTGVAGLAIVGGTIAAASGGEPAEAESKASSSAAKSSESDAKKDDPLSVSSNKTNKPKNDIDLGSVTTDSLGSAQVDVTITNNSSKTSDYWVEVEFLDANGKRIDTGVASENAVAAGQEVDTQAVGIEQVPDGTITAKVLTVDRFATAGS